MSYRQELRELACDSHGVIALREAASSGVPAVEVRKLASRGASTRLGQGVYRMEEAPADGLTEFCRYRHRRCPGDAAGRRDPRTTWSR